MPPEDNVSLAVLWVNSNAGIKEAPRVLNSFFIISSQASTAIFVILEQTSLWEELKSLQIESL